MKIFINHLFALIAGIILSFIQAPYGLWPLIFPCFSLLYYLYISTPSKLQTFTIGFLFAFGYFVSGLNWIGNALLIEGNDYRWVWPLAVIALPLLLSFFTALFLTIAKILAPNKSWLSFIMFCSMLSFSEFVRGYAFTGFPWNLYGYGTATNAAFSQSLSLIGPFGLTFVTIFWGASLGNLFAKTRSRFFVLLFTLISLAASYGYGYDRLNKNKTEYNDDVIIHVVQPNISQSDKWKNDNVVKNFEQHIAPLQTPMDETKKNIVLWPETAIPPVLLSSQAVHERLQTMLGTNGLLLAGALVVKPNENTLQTEYYNSLLAWTENVNGTNLYSKTHLVPFGEYIPFQKYIPLKTVTAFSGFARGEGTQTITVQGYPSFSPLICYEIIFPNKAVNRNAPRPDYILTITNDGWYGDSAGPRQHFMQARFRAIEQGIPVLRSANTGISGIIDPYGRVIKKIDLEQSGVIDNPLPLKTNFRTFYALTGDYLYLGIISMLFFLCIIFRKRYSI